MYNLKYLFSIIVAIIFGMAVYYIGENGLRYQLSFAVGIIIYFMYILNWKD